MALILRPFVKDFPIYETIMRSAYQNGTESAIIYAFTSVLVTGTLLFLLLHLCFKIAKAIVDLNYAGTFGLKGFSEENGVVTVETRSYVDVLSIKDDQVSYTHPVISATFQRRTDIPINLNFSMTRIQCPTCGASFNPVKNKYCPNCCNEYELITDDWVLVDLKTLK